MAFYYIRPYDYVDDSYRMREVIDRIREAEGVRVSVSGKAKDLTKWGRRSVVGTGIETLMTTLGSETQETLVSTNAITTVVSTSGSDTQNITLTEGHTVSGGDASFYNFGIGGDSPYALNGTTPVTIPTALFRSTRARCASPAVGDIHFYEGGTRTAANTHLTIPAGEVQTQKASTTISAVDYWILTGGTGSVLEKTGAWAQFRIERKPLADTYFYPMSQWVGASDASGTVPLIAPDGPFKYIPANHDSRIAVQANTANVDVAGGLVGVLAIIEG